MNPAVGLGDNMFRLYWLPLILVTSFLVISPTHSAEIRVGMLYPITGGGAIYGTPAMVGHRMAIDELNAKGGILDASKGYAVEHQESLSVLLHLIHALCCHVCWLLLMYRGEHDLVSEWLFRPRFHIRSDLCLPTKP